MSFGFFAVTNFSHFVPVSHSNDPRRPPVLLTAGYGLERAEAELDFESVFDDKGTRMERD